MSAIRLSMVLWLFGSLSPAPATADWLVTPFIGLKFGGNTNFVDLERGAGETKLALGGSGALLGDGVLGLEADFGYSPRFFERASRGPIVRSSVTTLMGSVIVAVPTRLTRDSLRPYVVGGLGLLHVGIDDVLRVFQVESNLLGLSVGAGASGPLTDKTSLRFELRHFTNLSEEDEPAVGFGATRLSFWRATVGITLRY